MKKMLCPQCKIAAMYVKNAAGERLLVYVTDQGKVVPKDPSQSLEGFDVSEVFFDDGTYEAFVPSNKN